MNDRWDWSMALLGGTSLALIGWPIYLITGALVWMFSGNLLVGIASAVIEYVVGVFMAAQFFR